MRQSGKGVDGEATDLVANQLTVLNGKKGEETVHELARRSTATLLSSAFAKQEDKACTVHGLCNMSPMADLKLCKMAPNITVWTSDNW